MTPSQRILLNTAAQYTRTILNVCLSLYSTRLILSALGQNDYGIYSVVAGVVAMLAFLQNALATTTQRYLSYYHGQQDPQLIHRIFGNSMLLHVLLGVGVLVMLLALDYPTIYHWLNIAPERREAAFVVFAIAALMCLISFIAAPLRALFIARENIVYISAVEVVDGVLKLGFAFALFHVTFDRLVAYALIMLGIQVFNTVAYAVYGGIRFPECHWPRWREWDKEYIRGLSSFAGWTVYASGCVIVRNQGIAVLLNIFCGTIANAAYGIATQVLGAVSFVSSSILNAMNPQLMKAEGAGDRQRMIRFAEYESKYAFLILALVAIPLIVEMDSILAVWLTEVPEYAVAFCRLVLLATLVDQSTIGLTYANQATGRIRNYTLIFYSLKLLTIAGVWVALAINVPAGSVLWAYVIVEGIGALMRMPLLRRQIGLSIRHFVKHVLLPMIIPTIIMGITAWLSARYIDIPYRFLLTITLTILIGTGAIWLTALEKDEKQFVVSLLASRKKK